MERKRMGDCASRMHPSIYHKQGGIVPKNHKSEFAGLPLVEQEEKIRRGVATFRSHGLDPDTWVAPSHTFDENTLRALRLHSHVRIVSDGIAVNPYKDMGFVWLPQQCSYFQTRIPFGIWTLCLHPSTMTNEEIDKFERQLSKYSSQVVDKDEALRHIHRRKTAIDKLFSKYYWYERSKRAHK